MPALTLEVFIELNRDELINRCRTKVSAHRGAVVVLRCTQKLRCLPFPGVGDGAFGGSSQLISAESNAGDRCGERLVIFIDAWNDASRTVPRPFEMTQV